LCFSFSAEQDHLRVDHMALQPQCIIPVSDRVQNTVAFFITTEFTNISAFLESKITTELMWHSPIHSQE